MSKKVMISLPDELLRQIDEAADKELRTRSELIREAVRFYLAELELKDHARQCSCSSDITEAIEQLAKKIERARREADMQLEAIGKPPTDHDIT